MVLTFLSACTKPAAVFAKIGLLVTLNQWVFIKKNGKIIVLAINEYRIRIKDFWVSKIWVHAKQKEKSGTLNHNSLIGWFCCLPC
mmetsp:Transcript_30683/g.55617  ORF Transcript_30683/g.55617 Transcript_30683/m.55617 type:complete len:85 (+) Transcript_30683:324-578(+)